LLLLRISTPPDKNAEIELRDAIRDLLGVVDGSSTRSRKGDGAAKKGKLNVAFLHYLERKEPSWLAVVDPAIRDEVNQLVIVCRLKGYIGVYCSDSAIKGVILKGIIDATDPVLKRFEPVPKQVLDGAFMGGQARTLWLSGIHRRTAVKADSKILSGIRLQSALNPLEDQSYHYTAARSVAKLKAGERPVGIAHGKASLWLSTTKNWTEFCDMVVEILEAISAVYGTSKAKSYQMPFLAEPVDDGASLGQPFDISFVPPELLTLGPDDLDQGEREWAEKWAYGCEFVNVRSVQDEVVAEARQNGKDLGTVKLKVEAKRGRLKLTAGGDKDATADDEEWTALMAACANPRWLKIRFDSGKTLSDGHFYQMQFRDYPFTGWKFVALAEGKSGGFDATKEKPVNGTNAFDVTMIGKQDSLFCWVLKNWFGLAGFGSNTGFLFCDDGANEIADFIHLDLAPDDGFQPRLTLIHVKGSKSAGTTRAVSVSDYEVVCGQAVKNLRSLEGIHLADIADQGKGKAVAKATWKDGKIVGDRVALIAALKSLGTNYRRRVVILQPRVTETALRNGQALLNKNSKSMEANRLRQLNTLLLEAEMGCRALGADFHVFGSDI
jgi:hypothetical protein